MNGVLISLAQATAPAPQGQPQGGSPLTIVVPFIIAIAAMFYISYRSNKKEQKRREDLLTSIKTGDKVLSLGGLYGIVTNVKEDCFVVKIADNVKVELAKSAVSSVVEKEKSKEDKK